MTKYTSNEQYEKDKAILIHRLGYHIEQGWDFVSDDLNDILDFIKQSKWVGAFDVTAYEDGYQAGYIDGANDEDEEDG